MYVILFGEFLIYLIFFTTFWTIILYMEKEKNGFMLF